MNTSLGSPQEPSAAFRRRFPPSCPSGYTREDLERYFGAKQGEDHSLWRQLHGQTGLICEGRRFNHDTREYEPTECAEHPHGFISYVSDAQEWYEGRPVSDW